MNKKKSKKGFVKDFTNNNLAGTPPTPPPGFQDSTILARYTEEVSLVLVQITLKYQIVTIWASFCE